MGLTEWPCAMSKDAFKSCNIYLKNINKILHFMQDLSIRIRVFIVIYFREELILNKVYISF